MPDELKEKVIQCNLGLLIVGHILLYVIQNPCSLVLIFLSGIIFLSYIME